MNIEYLKKYAEFAVKSGVNIQSGQTLIINADVTSGFFVQECVEQAYLAGAAEVVVNYYDEKIARTQMIYTSVEILEDVKDWQITRLMEYYKPGKLGVLRIIAEDPEIYKGIDSEKIDRASIARSKKMQPWREITMKNEVQWSIVAIPGDAWAKCVFPQNDVETAKEKLWEAIFKIARIEGGDPVSAWKEHTQLLKGYATWLNKLQLKSLRLTAVNGTDIEIGLADGHIWKGAGDETPYGVSFLPNIPTEEVFTAPHCQRVNGIVKTSMPYVYNGNLIEGISVRFEEGRVVEYSAEKGSDLLQQMMSADEGAKSIGEIALVPYTSTIRQSGLLFYNTLFDENAACHIAFGASYPDTVKGGGVLTLEELAALGMNHSLIHEDVMVGTQDMNIEGITKEGQTVQIFENGVWAQKL